jgi:hypothetical protein
MFDAVSGYQAQWLSARLFVALLSSCPLMEVSLDLID